MPKASEMRSEYIVHFMAPYKDPRLDEVQLENHLYFVMMTKKQAEAIEAYLKHLFDLGFIVHGYEVALADLVRVFPADLHQRISHIKYRGGA